MQPSSRKEAEISGTTEVENHPCLSGFHFQFVLFTTPSGFAEVTSDNQVEILVDTIERPEEIDIRRAKEAKERAEERLLQHKSRMEYYRNTTSLARAMARLKEANKYRH